MDTDLSGKLNEPKEEGTRLTPPITTEGDVTAKKEIIFNAFRNAITKLNKLSNLWKKDGNWIEDLRNCFSVLFKEATAIKSLGPLPYGVIWTYRREAGHLVCTSNTLSLLCKVVKDGWNKYYEDKKMMLTADQFEVIRLALQNLVIFSDGIEEVRCELAKDKEFLNSLTKILKSCFEPDILEGEKLTKEKSVVRNSLCILCNISQVDENVKVLQGLKNVGIITLYLDTVFRFVALAYLANIIKEDEIAELHGKDRAFDPMKFLSDLLSSALKDPLHQCKDESGIAWSAQECALIIRVLARNEKSKRMLAKVGCLHHLVELARGGTLDEQKEAVGAIWTLAFDKENQKMMLEDKTLNIFSMLLDLTKSLDCIRIATEGTLWLFRNELAQDEAYKDVLKDRSVMQSSDELERSHQETDVQRSRGHVMISYSINHREIATWIRDQLVANGYPVWMDIGNMGGSVAQTMAEAIESAHVFLFCCSRGYKNSSSCRQEADYASSLGDSVQMIPLLMENGYKPDGWLGFYVGRKYCYDFTGKNPRERTLQELLKSLNKWYDKTQDPPAVQDRPSPRSQTSLSELRKWTFNDMNRWIKKHNLPRIQFGRFTGTDLAALVTMRKEAPESFYRYVTTHLRIYRLTTIDHFIKALEDLTK